MDRLDLPGDSLFGRLPSNVQQALLAHGLRRRYPAGQRLLDQGATDRHAMLLLQGRVKVIVVDPSGFEVTLAIRGPGDIIGEVAALTGEPRTASVVAIDDSVTHVVHWPDLGRWVATHHEAGRELFRTQAHRLDWANQRRIDFTVRPAPLKIARVLADLAGASRPAHDGPIHVKLTQVELASLVGVAVDTAQAALRRLAADGLIERRRGAVVVHDLDRLRRLVESI